MIRVRFTGNSSDARAIKVMMNSVIGTDFVDIHESKRFTNEGTVVTLDMVCRGNMRKLKEVANIRRIGLEYVKSADGPFVYNMSFATN